MTINTAPARNVELATAFILPTHAFVASNVTSNSWGRGFMLFTSASNNRLYIHFLYSFTLYYPCNYSAFSVRVPQLIYWHCNQTPIPRTHHQTPPGLNDAEEE